MRLFWALFNFVGWIIALVGLVGLVVSIFTLNLIGGIAFFVTLGIGGMMINKVKSVKLKRLSKNSRNIRFLTREQIAKQYKISISDKDDRKKLDELLDSLERSGQIVEFVLGGETVYVDKKAGYDFAQTIKKEVQSRGRALQTELAIACGLPEGAIEGLVDLFNDGTIMVYEYNGGLLYVSSKALRELMDEIEGSVRQCLEKMGAGDKKQILTASRLTGLEAGLLGDVLEVMRLNGDVEVVEFPGKEPLYKINGERGGGFTNLQSSSVEIKLD